MYKHPNRQINILKSYAQNVLVVIPTLIFEKIFNVLYITELWLSVISQVKYVNKFMSNTERNIQSLNHVMSKIYAILMLSMMLLSKIFNFLQNIPLDLFCRNYNLKIKIMTFINTLNEMTVVNTAQLSYGTALWGKATISIT